MRPISVRWSAATLLAEQLVPVPEPFALALRPGVPGTPASVVARAARALLDLPESAPQPPSWLSPHQVPAFTRLCGMIHHYGGALLADAVGLGKSYVALAVALELAEREAFTLVVPAVLVPQWKRLLAEKAATPTVLTHESLSRNPKPVPPFARNPGLSPGVGNTNRLVIVDEAHRFRDPDTIRYRRLAELCVGARVLLVTATPVHNRLADLFHLFRLFLRDDALTALGVGSLIRAARGELDAAQLTAVAARLIVARSRARAGDHVSFPGRGPATTIRAGTAPDSVLLSLVQGISELRLGGKAAALLRLTLLRRLASSMPAFRATVERYRAFADFATEAALAGRRLETTDFQRWFPRDGTSEIQLTLLPLLLEPGTTNLGADSGPGLERLRALARETEDPKAHALERLLAGTPGKTIVFTDAVETARHLLRRLSRRFRVAAVAGASGWFGPTRSSTQEVLAAFAPQAQGAPPPHPALATDVLIATDLASEGLNLQDADRVIHFDLPWSPARLAQRVGRIDRLGSPHERIDTVAFAPPAVVGDLLHIERRLAAKLAAQHDAGAAQRESTSGPVATEAPLDWCDRLHCLATGLGQAAWAEVRSHRDAAVLVVRLGSYTEAFIVEGGEARAAPAFATALLELVAGECGVEPDRERVDVVLRAAAPVIRARLRALEAARWRAEDRDRVGRRLIPWVLTAARRASRAGDAPLLARLDHLVTRLTLGMTAGEEFSLRALLERRASLSVRDLLAWHERLPAVTAPVEAPEMELVAAVVFSTH